MCLLPVTLRSKKFSFDFRDVCNIFNDSLGKLSKTDSIPMWVLCKSTDDNKPLLICTHSYEDHFARGIVTYEGTSPLEEIEVENLIKDFADLDDISDDMVSRLLALMTNFFCFS